MPGPNSEISWSGKLGSSWFQLVILEPGAHSLISWSVVRQSTREVGVHDDGERVGGDLELGVLDRRLSSQAAISSSSIGREASEMSVSPAQNFSKPPPVPDSETDDLDVGVLLAQELGGGVAHREDGRRAVDGDGAAGAAAAVTAAGRTGVCAAAGGQAEHGDHRNGCEEDLGLSVHRACLSR